MAGRALGEILDDCAHGGLLTTADGEALAAEIARLRAVLARVRDLADLEYIQSAGEMREALEAIRRVADDE
jgi:hypothetical protein